MFVVALSCCAGDAPRVVAAADVKPKPKAAAKGMIEPKTSVPVWTNATLVPYRGTHPREPYAVGAAPAVETESAAPRSSIKLLNVEANDVSTSLIVNSKCQRALVSWIRPNRTGPPSTRLVLCDLEHGKSLGSFVVPTAAVPMALSDSGELIAVRFLPEAGNEQEQHVEVWRWGEKAMTRDMRFAAHTNSQKIEECFTYAAFLDEDRLATLTTMRQLIVWDWCSAKAIINFDIYDQAVDLSLSSDRKYLIALTNNGEVTAINSSTYAFGGYANPVDGFEQDMRLCSSGDAILINTVKVKGTEQTNTLITLPGFKTQPPVVVERVGRLLAFPCPEFAVYESEPAAAAPGKKPTKAVAERQPLAMVIKRQASFEGSRQRIDPTISVSGAVTLLDLRHQARAWEYTNIDRLTTDGATCWCLTLGDKGKDVALVPVVIPATELAEKMDRAVAEPDYFVLGEGSVLKLNLKGIPAADRDEAAAIIEKKLAEHNKWTIGAESDIELIAKVGEPVTEINNILQPPSVRVIEVEERKFTVDVTILYKGKPVYAGPCRSHAKLSDKPKGESLAAFFARNSGSPTLALTNLYIPPRKRFGPDANKPLGSTKVVPKYTP